MFDKHAVWCQCCSIIQFTLLASILVSCQSITLAPDIYWTLVFLFNSCTHFIVAEHAPVGRISTDTWMKIERQRSFLIQSIIFYWNVYSWHFSYWTFIHIPIFIGLSIYIKTPEKIFPIVSCWKLFTSPVAGIILASLSIVNLYVKRIKLKTSSFASKKIKQKYALKAIRIIIEAVILWSIRCEHRFPHTMRWKPLAFSLGTFALAILWCHFNVLDTHVSNNAIIIKNGHGMAASLTAAKKCKQCSLYITSLDMESSFAS